MKSCIMKTLLTFTFLCLQFFALGQQPINKIEPPYWWSGMENPCVELLIYGPNIGAYVAEIADEHVQLIRTTQMVNKNYLFLELKIDPRTPNKDVTLKFMRGTTSFTWPYSIKSKSEMAKGQQGLSPSDYIYLIFPDRFSNADSSNDAFSEMKETEVNRDNLFDRHGGDLQGIVNNLDYVEELGVTALWLNPVWENDQPKASYHGYAPTDIYAIDRRLGTNTDYKQFVAACHLRDIKVVKDIVYNHWGDQHWIYKDLPDSSWINFWPTYTKTSYKAPTLLDPYANENDRLKMTDGWFDHHMPDLNQRNPHLANYLIQNSLWWIGHFGIDAFRIDTYAYPDQLFMKELADRVLIEFPSFFMFGETWVHGTPIQAWFTGDNGLKKGYSSNLQSVTDFQLHYALNNALSENFGWTEGASRLYYTLAKDVVYKDAALNVTFLDNHDLSRVFSVVGENPEKLKTAFAFIMTTRGIPSLYYGTEIGLKNFANPDGLVRQDFPGGWAADSLNKFARAGRTVFENELFDYFARLGQYRKKNPELFKGSLTHFTPEEGIYVYFRASEKKKIMVVMNFNAEGKSLEMNRFLNLEEKHSARRVLDDRKVQIGKTLELKAYETIIFEIKL